ncbi:Lrp/AsnC family transcriptional regulator [Oceanicola sp. S124]|uniref:Lrp/AsnC family transcriptional regulator n=1 Tax=Oceanicola sp. S124 TaxID=1042378 RepID=UPI0002557992|nr:Lrp/AsnC family transcriptional regulator [Oceanicola sp. S124]
MLDHRDKRLLALLQRDSRRTNAELAEDVGLSLSACAKRVARLWSEGFLLRAPALIDRRRFRRPVTAAVMVTLTAPKASVSQDFARRITACPQVAQCHAVTGEFDFLLVVQERSIEAYHDFAQEVFGEWPQVASYRTNFLLRSYKNDTALPDFCLSKSAE